MHCEHGAKAGNQQEPNQADTKTITAALNETREFDDVNYGRRVTSH